MRCWRCILGGLAAVLAMPTVPAQAPDVAAAGAAGRGARILAAGAGAANRPLSTTPAPHDRATDAASLAQLLGRHQLPGPPPVVDFAAEQVVLRWAGPGPGAPYEMAMVFRPPTGAPVMRLRGRGEVQDGSRWFLIAVPKRTTPFDWSHLRHEEDAPPDQGRPTWWAQEQAGLPLLVVGVGAAVEAPLVVADALAWRDCWRGLDGVEPLPVDFTRHLALVVPATYRRVALLAGEDTVVRVAPAHSMLGDAPLPPTKPHAAVMLVARPARDLVLEVPLDDHRVVEALRLRPESPAAAAKLPVLRMQTLALPVGAAAEAAAHRAATAAEWRALRLQLAATGVQLPADWVDFATSVVVAVVGAPGDPAAGFEVSVAEEEGVDVLQAAQTTRADAAARPVLLLALPRRRAALAVVLRAGGPGETPVDRPLAQWPGSGD